MRVGGVVERPTTRRPDVLVGEEDLGLDPDGKGDALRVSAGREGWTMGSITTVRMAICMYT